MTNLYIHRLVILLHLNMFETVRPRSTVPTYHSNGRSYITRTILLLMEGKDRQLVCVTLHLVLAALYCVDKRLELAGRLYSARIKKGVEASIKGDQDLKDSDS